MKTLLLLLLFCTLATTAEAMGMPHRSTVAVPTPGFDATDEAAPTAFAPVPEVFSPNWWSHSPVSRFLHWVFSFFEETSASQSLVDHTTSRPAGGPLRA